MFAQARYFKNLSIKLERNKSIKDINKEYKISKTTSCY